MVKSTSTLLSQIKRERKVIIAMTKVLYTCCFLSPLIVPIIVKYYVAVINNIVCIAGIYKFL